MKEKYKSTRAIKWINRAIEWIQRAIEWTQRAIEWIQRAIELVKEKYRNGESNLMDERAIVRMYRTIEGL
jgi:prefoldin subunit 5